MNTTELDAAIEQANRVFSSRYPSDGAESEAPKSQDASGEPFPSLRVDTWPPVSLNAERRFGQAHAKLFPFIGRKVRTPHGPGTLIQVFSERVTVVIESELSLCRFFRPAEIEPVRWELL